MFLVNCFNNFQTNLAVMLSQYLSISATDLVSRVKHLPFFYRLDRSSISFHCILWFKWWVGGPIFSGIPIVQSFIVPWRLEEATLKVMGKQKRGHCRSSYQCHRHRRLLRLVALNLCRRSNIKWHRPHQLPSLLAVKTFPCRALQFSAPLILEPRQAIGLFPQSLKMLQLQGQLNRSQYSQMTISLMNQIGCHPFMCKFLQIGRHCRTHHLLRDPRTFTNPDGSTTDEGTLPRSFSHNTSSLQGTLPNYTPPSTLSTSHHSSVPATNTDQDTLNHP